jgi:hypothetical protein
MHSSSNDELLLGRPRIVLRPEYVATDLARYYHYYYLLLYRCSISPVYMYIVVSAPLRPFDLVAVCSSDEPRTVETKKIYH